jgi:hypothetical protein
MQVADLAPPDFAPSNGPSLGPKPRSRTPRPEGVWDPRFEVRREPAERSKTPQCHIAPQNRRVSDQLSRFWATVFGPVRGPVWGQNLTLTGGSRFPDLG